MVNPFVAGSLVLFTFIEMGKGLKKFIRLVKINSRFKSNVKRRLREFSTQMAAKILKHERAEKFHVKISW